MTKLKITGIFTFILDSILGIDFKTIRVRKMMEKNKKSLDSDVYVTIYTVT